MSDVTFSKAEDGKPGAPAPAQSWVHEVLETDQLTASKMRYGRRELGRGTVVLLWALRVYVVLMVFIVGLAVWHAFH